MEGGEAAAVVHAAAALVGSLRPPVAAVGLAVVAGAEAVGVPAVAAVAVAAVVAPALAAGAVANHGQSRLPSNLASNIGLMPGFPGPVRA